MYLWAAVDVDGQLKEIREKVEQATDAIGVPNAALTLPLHVSLRISFKVGDLVCEEAIARIAKYYGTLDPFDITVREIERNGTVVWISMEKNPALDRIHTDLVSMCLEEYGVPPHEFDLAFYYHATLWAGDDAKAAEKAYAYLREEAAPERLTASKFLLGCSKAGAPGTFHVVREISVHPRE